MTLPVTVKSTRKGIRLILSDTLTFVELLEEIRRKFEASGDFFRNADFTLTFCGRELTEQEQCEIVTVITKSCGANIICILEENELQDAYIEAYLQQMEDEKQMKSGQFYKGDILAGETFESETSVIVLGNVRKGGKVISRGNIIISGTLEGYAYAGAGGREHSFICVQGGIYTEQIRVSDAVLKTTKIFKGSSHGPVSLREPHIAIAKDNTIHIEPLTKGYFNCI